MRILQLISSAGQYGAENMLLELSIALEKLDCQLIVGVFENRDERSIDVYRLAQDRGLDAQLIQYGGKFDRHAMQQVESCIRENSIEVVHSHGYKSNFYGFWGARNTGACTVATCHGWPGTSTALRFYYLLDKILLRRFDRIVAVSDPIAKVLSRIAIPERKRSQISNGVDTDRFQNSRVNGNMNSRNFPGKRVGVVARLSPEKGIPFLFRAAEEVLQEFPDTEFCLVGDGPERSRLEGLARELGIERNVAFWGLQTDMPSIYAKLDVFVLPSLQEGLPMAILEAMAAARPVIATRVGAIPKVVLPEKTGTLVEPGDTAGLRDAILRFLRDPATATEFGRNGAEQVRRNHSAMSMAQKYLEIYQEAQNQHRPGTGRAHQAI